MLVRLFSWAHWRSCRIASMKFSIRDVLWLTVLAALAVCWGIDRVQLRRDQLNARQAEQRARMEAEQALYASKLAQAHAEMARAAEAQLQSTATAPDPQTDSPPATSAP